MIGWTPPAFEVSDETFLNPRDRDAFLKFKAAILPHNLRIQSDAVRVQLRATLQDVAQAMPGFGAVLSLTRNAATTLSTFNQYPRMSQCRTCTRMFDPAGQLAIQANPGISVKAVQQSVNDVTTLGLEMVTADGICCHRFCLTRGSDWSRFMEFVTVQQSRFSVFEERAVRRYLGRAACKNNWIRRHAERKRKYGAEPSSVAERIDFGELSAGVLDKVEWGNGLSVTVFNEDVVQSCSFRPNRFESRRHQSSLTDGMSTWQFDVDQVKELWRVRLPIDGEAVWALEAFDDHDRILFAVI